MELSKNQIRYLRQIGHNSKLPFMRIGDKGLSEAFTNEMNDLLITHELVKVRISADDRSERSVLIASLLGKMEASLVQKIGKICLLYRRNEEKPLIALPSK